MDEVQGVGEIAVGYRIECDGYLGTVRYIGLVPPTKGKILANCLIQIQLSPPQ